MRVTIGIKALNEERRIAACIESALTVTQKYDGEVILADSGSTDRTIEIAGQYPIRIVQLANPSERCCGAGAQLAFQFAKGEYFCLVDGDMVLSSDFVSTGIDFLIAHDNCAGVGGSVREMNLDNADFQIRAMCLEGDRNRKPGLVDRLDGGGIYRSSAIRETGYFADRNLHAFEEFELAMRLRARGWTLTRIDQQAVYHYGYQMSGYHLLWHRMRSGYTACVGEVIRAACSGGYFRTVLQRLDHVRVCLLIFAWWVFVAVAASIFGLAGAALLFLPVAFLSSRRRSLRLGIYSFVSWNFIAVGMIVGLMHKRVPPNRPLASVQLSPNQETRGVTIASREDAAAESCHIVVEEGRSQCAF
jgi:glycosyltransferase involved in cell wall biosynthesis